MDELELFGKELIEKVRDITIQDWDGIVDKKSKGITAKAVQEKLSIFSEEQIEVIKWLMPKIVDTTIHNFLCMLESSKKYDLKVKSDNGIVGRLQDESDGLYGELYTKNGWIMKFSKQRYEEL